MAAPANPPPGSDEPSAEEELSSLREELTQRLDAMERGEGSARPWEAVRAELLEKLRDVGRQGTATR